MYLTPLYLSLFHINDTYHLSSQFLLYIFPLLSTTSHHLSILLPLVVSWLLRSSPPLDDSLPPGHVAPFLRAFSTEEAWCTLSCISFSRYSRSFLFLPLPRSSAVRVSLSRPWCFLLSPLIVFSAPVCCHSPPSLFTLISPHYLPHQPFSFAPRSAHLHHSAPYLCQRRRCHRYSDARTYCYSYFFAWECVRADGRASARSHPHEGDAVSFSGPCDMCTHARDSSLIRAPGNGVPFLCGATGIT